MTRARSPRKVDLQIRGVPVELRRKIGRRAASKGVSMSKYVIELLSGDVERLPLEEWLAMVDEHRPKRELSVRPSDVLREIRDELDEGIED